MFCKSCGSEVKTGEKFCRSCGAPIEGNSGTDAFGELADKISENKTSLGGVLIGKILVLVALICFFFTFMTVSCAGETRKVSGKDMIFGDSSITDSIEKQYSSHSTLFNIFVCASAVSGIAAIGLRKRKTSAVLAGVSGVLLIVFRFTAKFYYKIGDQSLGDWEEAGLEVGFGFPLYLAIVLFIAAAAIIMKTASDETVSLPPPPVNNTYTTPPDANNNNNNTTNTPNIQ